MSSLLVHPVNVGCPVGCSVIRTLGVSPLSNVSLVRSGMLTNGGSKKK